MLFNNTKTFINIIFLFQNLIESSDPVLNPFYYAQDQERWFDEVAAKACEESRQQEIEKKTLKKKKKKKKKICKSLRNTSFIMCKEPGHVQRIIKIIVHDVDGRHNMEEIDSDSDSASVNIQYLVRSDFDEIMSETECLVTKIVKKLSST